MSRSASKSSVLHTHPTTPVENYLCQHPQGLRLLQDAQAIIGDMTEQLHLSKLDLLTGRLIKVCKPFVWRTPNLQNHVWDTPKWRLFYSKEGWSLEIPTEGASLDKALDAMFDLMQWFAEGWQGAVTSTPGSELFHAMEAGIEALGDDVQFPTAVMTEEHLRLWVMAYCDGKIFTSLGVPDDMVRMIFLPLFAMKVPPQVDAALDAVVPNPGEQPEAGPALDAWKRTQEKRSVVGAAVMTHYMRNLGLLWEEYCVALRKGVNGYPIFMSARTMSKADMARVLPAVEREMERRKSAIVL